MNRELQALQVMEAALDRPTAEQDSYVREACDGDSALLRKVQALLNAAAQETGFLATHCGEVGDPLPRQPAHERIGEYRIVREIGRGGMGVVYEAEHDAMQRRVALKILSAGPTPSENQLTRFYREARAAGKLHHTNIVPVFEVGCADDVHYYTMQFIEGANLDVVIEEIRSLRRTMPKSVEDKTVNEIGYSVAQRFLDSHSNDAAATTVGADSESDGSQQPAESKSKKSKQDSSESVFLSVDLTTRSNTSDVYYRRVAAVGIQAAEALEYAHQNGTLHRDVKPANVVLDQHGIVWILDFGLAKSGHEALTVSGDVVGTIRYMSPERFEGKADARSDTYSLGLTLYELATLKCAFDAQDRSSLLKQVTSQDPPSPRSVDGKIPRDLETIILKSIEREPNQRYQSAAEMADDLRLFLLDHPISARRISLAERAWRICRRNPVVSSLAVSLLALLMVIAVGSMRFAFISNQQKDQALAAERGSRHRRYDLNYQSAQALRKSNDLGRRFEALASIEEAVDLLPLLDFTPQQSQKERTKLRSEAASALGLFDLRESRSWPASHPFRNVTSFSGDYELLARAVEGSGEIQIRSVDRNQIVRSVISEFGQTYGMRFSSDNNYLATQNLDPGTTISIWDIGSDNAGDEPLLSRRTHHHGSATFSEQDALVAVGLHKSLEVYELPNTTPVATIPLDFAPMNVQFSEDGAVVAVAPNKARTIEFWRWGEQPERVRNIQLPDDAQALRTFVWSQEKDILIAGLFDGSILIWRHGLEREPERLEVHKHTVVELYLHPSEPILFSQGWDDTVRVVDLVTGRQTCRLERFTLLKGGFSPDGKRIGLASDDDESVGIWELSTPCAHQIRFELDGLDAVSVARRAMVHPVHSNVLLAAHDRQIAFFDLGTKSRIAHLDDYDTAYASFSSDGKSLYAFDANGSVQIPVSIEVRGNRTELKLGEARPVLGRIPGASKFVLSEDERLLLATVHENSGAAHARLISLEDDSRQFRFDHVGMTSAAISADNKWVATAAWKFQGVKVWNAQTGEDVTTLLPDIVGCYCGFDPSGRYLVVSQNEEIYVWSTDDWSPVEHAIDRMEGIMGGLDFSHDGELLAADHTRYIPQLIDWQARRPLMLLEGDIEDTQRSYSFSADGTTLCVAGANYVRVWNLVEIKNELTRLGLGW